MIVTGGPPTTFEQLVEYFKLCREFADNSLYVWAYVTQLKIPLVYTKDFS